MAFRFAKIRRYWGCCCFALACTLTFVLVGCGKKPKPTCSSINQERLENARELHKLRQRILQDQHEYYYNERADKQHYSAYPQTRSGSHRQMQGFELASGGTELEALISQDAALHDAQVRQHCSFPN